MRVPRLPDSMLPGDLQESDPYFDMPSVDENRERKPIVVTPPETIMVFCVECQHWWKDKVVEEKWWKQSTDKLCAEHSKLENVA